MADDHRYKGFDIFRSQKLNKWIIAGFVNGERFIADFEKINDAWAFIDGYYDNLIELRKSENQSSTTKEE